MLTENQQNLYDEFLKLTDKSQQWQLDLWRKSPKLFTEDEQEVLKCFQVFPITDEENLLMYYLGWWMSGGVRFVSEDFTKHYQRDSFCQDALTMIMDEFNYSFNDVWNLCRE